METTTTTYANLTDAGKQLAGKLLPFSRHYNGLPFKYTATAPRGIAARKPETADKYHARIWAAAVKDQTDQHAGYIGRPDQDWTLRATDGTIALFERDRANDRPALAKPIATLNRPIAFELTPALELAIKRAKITSAPNKCIELAIGNDWIDVLGDDLAGTTSAERVNVLTVDAVGSGAMVRVNQDLMLLFFGAPRTTIASVDTAIGVENRCPSMAVDYAIDGWRYVLALMK
jgi:hypothetical protein